MHAGIPSYADANQEHISILAPIGTAMPGYKVANTFTRHVPDGE